MPGEESLRGLTVYEATGQWPEKLIRGKTQVSNGPRGAANSLLGAQ